MRAVWLALLVLVAGGAVAQTQQDHADDATTWGNDNSGAVEDAAASADPDDVVPGYAGTDTPLSDYYHNQATGDLEADAVEAVIIGSDPTIEYAWEQSQTPILEFSEDDPVLVNSWGIQNDTSAEEEELVMTQTDCVDGTVETAETTIETCTAWTVPEEAFCDSSLDVAVDVSTTTYTATVRALNGAGRPDVWPLRIYPNLNDRRWWHDWGMGENRERIGIARISNALGLPADFDCASITDSSIEIDGNFISVGAPRCFAGGRVYSDIRYNWGPAGGTITYTITATAEPVYTDTWSDSCPALIADGPCEAQPPAICEAGAETRLITGSDGERYPVFRDCWRYRTPLLCAGSVTTDEGYCGELVDRGCSPIDSVCDGDGTCEHTYECPLDGWSEPADDCTSTSAGLSGIEFDTGVEPSNDFGAAAANIQAMEEAALDLDSDGVMCRRFRGNFHCVGELTIFNGEDMRCKKAVLGFSNCCSRSGWSLGWADECNAQEEQLRVRRKQGQCFYVGRYCSEDSIFGCLAKTRTFCCFRSKLGRIIHEQGRPQIGMGWGGARAPECDGFTSAQLASLDFSAIDFSEYFADAFANVSGGPDNATMESIIDAYITTLSGSSCSQFDPDYPDC